MLSRDQVATLLPHGEPMILLDRVEAFTDKTILCSTSSHLRSDNPLRRRGTLACVHAIEYAAQAAAVHGALQSSGASMKGYLGSVKDVELLSDRLDVPGALTIEAEALLRDARGAVYRFVVRNATATLASGRFTIVFAS